MVLDAAALRQSVQKTPPRDALPMSSFVAVTERGPILPRYGSKERDRKLRTYYRNEYNTLAQGAFAGLVKKITSSPWEVRGDPGWAKYFQDLFQDAQFGRGWKEFVSKLLVDYFTQDFGGVIEVIGPGDPSAPLIGAVTGLAQLDALRCFATGNFEFPIVYFNSYSGKMHRMHYTRVMRIVDMPDPDERIYGSGMCALSRAIAIVNRELLMGRYIEQSLDDKPRPGFMVASNLTAGELEKAVAKYKRDQQSDERPVWGDTFWLHSVDPTAPAKLESVTFAQTPDKFSYPEYVELNINALALALGVDKQELWELSGQGIGTGAQSQILAQKSRGKGFGDVLSTLERAFNIAILPDGVEFQFKFRDDESDEVQARIDASYMGIAQQMASTGLFSPVEIRSMLADRSDTFAQVLVNTEGQVQATDEDQIETTTEANLNDVEPMAAPGEEQTESGERPAFEDTDNEPENTDEDEDKKKFPFNNKAYSSTVAEFERQFKSIVDRAVEKRITRRQYETFMLAALNKAGKGSYLDGLRESGISEMDQEDEMRVQSWLVDQIDFIDKLGTEIYDKGLSPALVPMRAALWSSNSVQKMFTEGRLSADKNGLYEWVYFPLAEHCEDCKRLNGQVHRLKEWYRRDITPTSKKLECGLGCKCKFRKTTKPAQGRF